MPVDQQLGGGNVSTADTWPGLDLPPGIAASQAIASMTLLGVPRLCSVLKSVAGGGNAGAPGLSWEPCSATALSAAFGRLRTGDDPWLGLTAGGGAKRLGSGPSASACQRPWGNVT